MDLIAMLAPFIGKEKMQEMERHAVAAGERMIQAEKDIAEIKAMVREIHAAIVPQVDSAQIAAISHDGFDNSTDEVNIHGG